jgi:hypothetical protein
VTLTPLWSLADAVVLAVQVEQHLKPVNTHVALGGSVMYRGHSFKDLDLILYPHGAGTEVFSKPQVLARLKEVGFSVIDCHKPRSPEDALDDAEAVELTLAQPKDGSWDSGSLAHVFICSWQNKRVDFLFMRPR